MLVYIGTYTNNPQKNSKGIYIYRMDRKTGALTEVGTAPFVDSPAFLAIAPNHKYLYAANEIADFQGQKSGAVSAFSIEPKTGELTLLNQEASVGEGPCHLTVDRQGKNVLTASYGNGVVSVLPIQANGHLSKATSVIQHTGSSVNPQRQMEPHAHSINMDMGNRHAYAADLGVDKVFIYRLDAAKGILTPNDPPFAKVAPGSGPRHFAFHPNGRNAYVINEMLCTVTAFDYDSKTGALTEIQTLSTLPPGTSIEQTNSSTAEVQVHPSGKFLYGSNRGHNTIAAFTIDQATGKLTPAGHTSTQGKTPRNFGIDPTGTFLLAANQDTDNVVVYRINAETGALTPTGTTISVPMPVCVKFLAPSR